MPGSDASGGWSNVSSVLQQHKKSLFLTSLGSQFPSWPVEPPPLSPRAVSSPPPSPARGPPSPLPTQTSRLSVGRTKVHHYQSYSLHGSNHTRWTARLSWGGDKDKTRRMGGGAAHECTGMATRNICYVATVMPIFAVQIIHIWTIDSEVLSLVLTYRVLWWLATLRHIIRNKLWQLIFRTNISLRIPIRYNIASGGKWVGEGGKCYVAMVIQYPV